MSYGDYSVLSGTLPQTGRLLVKLFLEIKVVMASGAAAWGEAAAAAAAVVRKRESFQKKMPKTKIVNQLRRNLRFRFICFVFMKDIMNNDG